MCATAAVASFAVHMPSLYVLEFLLKHLASGCQCVYIKVIKASDLKEAEKRDSPTLLKRPRQIAYRRKKKPAPVGFAASVVDHHRLPGTLPSYTPSLFSCSFLRRLHSFKWLLNAPIAEMDTHINTLFTASFSSTLTLSLTLEQFSFAVLLHLLLLRSGHQPSYVHKTCSLSIALAVHHRSDNSADYIYIKTEQQEHETNLPDLTESAYANLGMSDVFGRQLLGQFGVLEKLGVWTFVVSRR